MFEYNLIFFRSNCGELARVVKETPIKNPKWGHRKRKLWNIIEKNKNIWGIIGNQQTRTSAAEKELTSDKVVGGGFQVTILWLFHQFILFSCFLSSVEKIKKKENKKKQLKFVGKSSGKWREYCYK